MVGGKPLFVAWIDPSHDYGHRAEMALVAGNVAPNDAVKARTEGPPAAATCGLVMHRRGGHNAIVLVRGLTLPAGQTLLASLAAELRARSR